jgi:hypothetical protein
MGHPPRRHQHDDHDRRRRARRAVRATGRGDRPGRDGGARAALPGVAIHGLSRLVASPAPDGFERFPFNHPLFVQFCSAPPERRNLSCKEPMAP